MAPGSQKWKGNWADLVNAAIKTKKINQPYSPCSLINSDEDSNSDRLYVPTASPSAMAAANKNNPPKPVMPNATRADFLESSSWLLNPIKKKELMLVNSQKTNNEMTLSERTNPNMEAMKKARKP